MKRELRHIAFMLVMPLALAGCGGSDNSAGGTAAGEVLPGSVSDAMLPLDTVKSQPPPAPMVEASGAARERKPEAPGAAEPSVAASEPATDAPDVPAEAASGSAPPAAE